MGAALKSAAAASGLAVLFLIAATATPPAPTPETLTVNLPRHQDLLMLLPGQRLMMHTTLILPAGKGPFPLALINHGSMQSSYARAQWHIPDYTLATAWLLQRGFAVARPVRPGHGITGEPYFEDQGRYCQRIQSRALYGRDSINRGAAHGRRCG